MDRPECRDKSINEYIDHLEALIEAFKTHTRKKFYLGIQRQLDFLAEEMLSEGFKVSLKQGNENYNGFFDILSKGETIVKAMQKFEQEALPNNKSDKPQLIIGSEAEKHIFGKNGTSKV